MNKMLTFTFLMISGLCISGCSDEAPPADQTQLPAPSPESSSMDITFKITGTAQAALMDYRCMDPADFENQYVLVPWEKSRTCSYYPGGKITLTASFYTVDVIDRAFPKTSGPGVLTCEIYADGELVDSDTRKVEQVKGWPSASCSYQP